MQKYTSLTTGVDARYGSTNGNLTKPERSIVIEPDIFTQKTMASDGDDSDAVRLKRRTVADDIAQHLRLLQLNGKLQPGLRLTEEQLCKQFNVSRTPVREALRSLQKEGMLVQSGARGVCVPTLSKKDIEDLWDVRCALEGLAVVEAAARISTNQMKGLEDSVSIMKALVDDNSDAVFRSNVQFHEGIIIASQNQWLTEYIMRVWTQVQLMYLLRYALVSAGHTTRSIEEHEAILAAMKAGDGQRGRELMEQHIRESEHILTAYAAE
jgi:DNA-binding GntR family transcriptional regulator